MATPDDLARAALSGESLKLRSLCHDLLNEYAPLSNCPPTQSTDHKIAAAAASLIELLALRTNQEPPKWTASVEGLDEPIFLVRAAMKMRHLRELCENESPEPLRRRGLLAPPNFLETA
jgi:hypothetical protein